MGVERSLVLSAALQGCFAGSASLTANADGSLNSEQRYTAFGEVRWASGELSTDYRYTGQLSQAGEMGLYYYVARWYDPYITQFTQPDSIVPDPYNPLDWNRYAYVRYNPINNTDPSGNFACEYGETYKECSEGREGREVKIKVSSSYSGTQAEAERYMNLANTPGWWNNWGTELFSVKDYLQRLLGMEFNVLPNGYSGSLQELTARNFYEWCDGFCNPNSSFDLLHYIAIRKLNTPGVGRDLNPKTIGKKDALYPADFISAIVSPNPEWKTGCKGGNVVCTWGNTVVVNII